MATVALVVSACALGRFSAIAQGRVHVERDFIPPHLVEALRADIAALDQSGRMTPSGLSNSVAADQGFGTSDRRVCRVTPDLGGNERARRDVIQRLDALLPALSESLGRGPLLTREFYLSTHGAGSRLPIHVDERHEELKGSRGWLETSRRSIAWLVYLGADGGGGALRTYSRAQVARGARVGAHEGNLQVGWRRAGGAGDEPVFLDSWLRSTSPEGGPDVPMASLYTLSASGERRWLCLPFHSVGSEVRPEGRPGAVACPLARWLPPSEQTRFIATDAAVTARLGDPQAVLPPDTEVVDVLPEPGMLTLFDAVAVPHEVLPVRGGYRMAVAGWLHEGQQGFPPWLDATQAA